MIGRATLQSGMTRQLKIISNQLSTTSTQYEKSVNSVTLLGRVGNQPELRGAGKEHSCATFSLATSTWKKNFNDTEYLQQTEWHNIAVFNPYLREMIMEQVKKGERVHVQGKLKYSMYEKYGVKIRSASIHADELIRLNQQASKTMEPQHESELMSELRNDNDLSSKTMVLKQESKPMSEPRPEPRNDNDLSKLRLIFFDLETTGVNPESNHDGIQICSIAASFVDLEDGQDHSQLFEAYFKPTCDIQPEASKVNGMEMRGNDLFMGGKLVEEALQIDDGIQSFITWIDSIKDDIGEDTKIVMVAHNCFNYDAVVLLKNLKMFGYELPKGVVFADTMNMMRMVKKKGLFKMKSFSLNACLKHYFKHGQGDHTAISDTKNLIKVAHRGASDLGFNSYQSFLENDKSLMKYEEQIDL